MSMHLPIPHQIAHSEDAPQYVHHCMDHLQKQTREGVMHQYLWSSETSYYNYSKPVTHVGNFDVHFLHAHMKIVTPARNC